jgi:hypothetical protein
MPPTLAVEQKIVAKLLKLYRWLKRKKWEDGSVRFAGEGGISSLNNPYNIFSY